MFATPERLGFRQGDLILRIPRLDLETELVGDIDPAIAEKLLDGTATRNEQIMFFGNSGGDALLKLGVVLLNSATLPGPGVVNSNVSLSGHRDVDGMEFYYIHTITEGDLMFLQHKDVEYIYEYVDTKVHAADDWSITYCEDYNKLTLISCDPIGTSRNRIVATGRLVGSRATGDAALPESSSSPSTSPAA